MSDNLKALVPGPPWSSKGHPLPPPLPAGVLPPEDSPMWHFTPKCVQQGEEFIQDDTRAWFRERDCKVVICRAYPDHPRWMIAGAESIRAKLYNGNITAEIHMMARVHAGKPDVPDWVPARLSFKQSQADLSFRLTKITRDVFRKEGKGAMEAFATKAPGQFIKFVGATFIPKQIEATLNTDPNAMPKERVVEVLDLIQDELNRRVEEAKLATATPMEFVAPAAIGEVLEGVAQEFKEAAATEYPGVARVEGSHEAVRNLKRVVDVMTPTDGWD